MTTAVTLGSDRAGRARSLASAPLALGAAGVTAGTLAAYLGPAALGIPVALAASWWLVRHPHALLAAYLAIGVFKGTPLLRDLPVDPTLASAMLLLGVCAQRLLTGRALTVPTGLAATFALIGALLVVSLNWTPERGYGGEKVLEFWTLTLLATAAPFCLIESARDVRTLLGWLLVTAVVGAAVAVLFGSVSAVEDINDYNRGRLEFAGLENTIFTSRLICVGAIVALFAPAVGLGGRAARMLPVLGLVLVAVAAAIGSRGPILSLVAAVAFTLVVLVVRSPGVLPPLVIAIVIATAVLPLVPLPETSVARLQGLVQNPLGALEGDGRPRLYREATALAREHPLLGVGAGGFRQYSSVLTRKDLRYPHNIFLEAAAELGLAAAIALLLAVLAVLLALCRRLWSVRGQRDRMLLAVVTALLLFTLFNAQLSGDLNDNRAFWTALALGWLLARHGVLHSGDARAGHGRTPVDSYDRGAT